MTQSGHSIYLLHRLSDMLCFSLQAWRDWILPSHRSFLHKCKLSRFDAMRNSKTAWGKWRRLARSHSLKECPYELVMATMTQGMYMGTWRPCLGRLARWSRCLRRRRRSSSIQLQCSSLPRKDGTKKIYNGSIEVGQAGITEYWFPNCGQQVLFSPSSSFTIDIRCIY